MAISEESRHHLYQRLEQVLGPKEATVLMEHLPPVGWADVATKRDLDVLETHVNMRFDRMDERFAHIDRRFEGMDRRFDRLEERLVDQFREFRSLLIGVMSVMAALFAVIAGAIVAAIKV